ncbi:uncharacterized protein LOC124269827 [Haliotis rubra]|uniref:uncharacterized protein LOC124269827 n=1 Tax=Haliotis rubra TaxID=36100 RepID=UPI001EE52703|nr:uncharacterized protein LOC124269827 [Haliotis rubra]XP_046560818.1 uncharacterized protein LOC124269827 [Haliotis rubra]
MGAVIIYDRRWTQRGPLALFDRVKTANTLIISPASQFMSSSIWRQNASTGGDNVYWGTMGGVENVPADVENSFILFCGNQGINKAFVSWGQILQTWYGRTDRYVKSDFTINYLGYWTDDGAYYFNIPEKGKNYQDTILDINNYIKQLGVPVRYIQYDWWWYYYDKNHGVITWEAKPSIFPDGLQWLYNKTELPVLAHSMFWSSNTTYAKANGGKYDFLIEGEKSLPLEEKFWNDLLADARKWGLLVYEQDFLNIEFERVHKLWSDIDLGRQWLHQMGNGAAKNGLTLQYCMALPRNVLQALEIPSCYTGPCQRRLHSQYGQLEGGRYVTVCVGSRHCTLQGQLLDNQRSAWKPIPRCHGAEYGPERCGSNPQYRPSRSQRHGGVYKQDAYYEICQYGRPHLKAIPTSDGNRQHDKKARLAGL